MTEPNFFFTGKRCLFLRNDLLRFRKQIDDEVLEILRNNECGSEDGAADEMLPMERVMPG